MTTAIVRGLLIEGVDYSGKTTVATALVRKLEACGQVVCRRECFMQSHPIFDGLLMLAKQSDRMDERDICYTACILLDVSLPPPELPLGYLIQERHVDTQIGRNSFFYDDDEKWQVATMRNLRRRFSTQVYLTSDLASKRTRTRSRPPKSPRDALLAGDPALHQRYDDYMRQMLPSDEPWLVIDTSLMTPDEVCARILAHIEQRDELVEFARA